VQRQLNLYGFKCISRGSDKGAFFHPQFKKGDWEIVKKIARYTPTKKYCDFDNGKSQNEKECNFTSDTGNLHGAVQSDGHTCREMEQKQIWRPPLMIPIDLSSDSFKNNTSNISHGSQFMNLSSSSIASRLGFKMDPNPAPSLSSYAPSTASSTTTDTACNTTYCDDDDLSFLNDINFDDDHLLHSFISSMESPLSLPDYSSFSPSLAVSHEPEINVKQTETESSCRGAAAVVSAAACRPVMVDVGVNTDLTFSNAMLDEFLLFCTSRAH
jgi:hypothetical protein